MPVPMLTKAPMSAVVRPEKAIITGSMGRVKSFGISWLILSGRSAAFEVPGPTKKSGKSYTVRCGTSHSGHVDGPREIISAPWRPDRTDNKT